MAASKTAPFSSPSARGRDALLRHYAIECELADRLRAAAPAERKELYRRVYDELFSRVSDHPQNARKHDPTLQAARTARQLRFLDRFLKPDSVYLEVGPGDCHLARTIALRVGRVYAVDVSELIAGTDDPPANFRLIVSDGVTIDVPPGSVHVAYSNQLMEHLHPDDASEQLGEIYRALAPGGVYVCVTPHRYSGPHDISQYFDAEARGFHLKEYSYRELRDLFRAAGFVRTSPWGGCKGRFLRLPEWLVLGVESILGRLPARIRRTLARSRPVRTVFGTVTITGRKGNA
jgi:SAM-dependent methyltransferase